jgi:hypothetical protein
MLESLQVSDGCRVIPLWRNISGDNFHPVYKIVGYTVVDEIDFDWLNKYRWLMAENSRTGDCYAVRYESQGGKRIHIFMAREILNLPHGVGCGSDEAEHRDHNTLNNRRRNLRRATSSQNNANKKGYSLSQRFKGVRPERGKYLARIKINRSLFYLISVPKEVEAALMYNYAAYLLYGEFAELNIIPEDEMPSYERQWELYDMVVTKLRSKGFPCADALKREECN